MHCECIGLHSSECLLGRRLKIKYCDKIQKIWNKKGAEHTEKLIDRLLRRKNEK
ncbi:hypothetical protein LCGC14_3140560 [marine sediment metagenome]|uniref:Uncharacterized protein n=1 Tax=marine sediment metagenome TaxID=412755 RepID=A0A0F8Y404_9ZZZZ